MKTILAIETSCDETGVAIIKASGRAKPRFDVFVNLIASQIAIHKKYGGVVPHLAAREHEKNLPILFTRAMRAIKRKGLSFRDIDYIAVTKGPGISPALWRGIKFAKELAEKMHKPLVGVDHMQGHIAANFIKYKIGGENPKSEIRNPKFIFPALALVVSGGHTQLVLMKKLGSYKLLGETVDDAAGEAFDKVARMLGLPYPGGPEISKLAQTGNPAGFAFPRPMLAQKNYNFSFSGLKTSVLYTIRGLPKLTAKNKRDIAASFQQAVIDVLIAKTLRAAKEYGVGTIMLAGGVAANKALRAQMRKTISSRIPNSQFYIPDPHLCTDNAAMIGAAAYVQLSTARAKKRTRVAAIKAEPSRQIDDL